MITKKLGWWALLLAALTSIALVSKPAFALLVRPIILDLTSSGQNANGQIEVVNDRNAPMTVELKVSSFIMPEQGPLTMGPDASADFVIFPTIAQLQPGSRQVFRFRYVGEPQLAQSRLYMLSSSELPVTKEGADAGADIEILYAISTMVGVRAPGAKPAISVAKVERAMGGQDGKEAGLRIVFRNEGAAHGYVGNAMLNLSSGSWRKAMDSNATSKAFGIGLVPAGASRSLFIPVEQVPASGEIRAVLKAASAS